MTDNLLIDEIMLRSFCESVLHSLMDDEVYIVMLAARKKYDDTLRRSTEMLDTLILRDNSSDYIYRKLKKFLYVGEHDDIYYDNTAESNIPSKSMVAYIDIAPKSTIKAFIKFTKDYLDRIYELHTNSIFGNSINVNNYRVFKKFTTNFFSCLAQSTSQRNHIIVDIDKKDKRLLKSTLNKIYNQFPKEEHNYIQWVSETRGGYHIILEYTKPLSEFLHKTIKPSSKYIEVNNKNTMTPIPGTLQGGFLVKGVNGSMLAL